MEWKIPLFRIHADEKDVEAVSKVINRGTFWADGPEIKEFEQEIAKYNDVKYAVAFNSGTSATHAMLLAYDITDGEVIVPSFTFISTANCPIMTGSKPVFADIEEETFGLDVKDVNEKINDKTKAVFLVHYAGCPARDTEKIKKLCEEKNILFFEDAAEAMGAKINGKMIGSLSDAGMLSFCQSKIISTGEGGAIITNSEEIYEKLKLIRSHGRLEGKKGYFSDIGKANYMQLGYNLRMPTMCASLGISQLNKVDKLIQARKDCANTYETELKNIKEITFPKVLEGLTHVYQLYTILLSTEKIRDGLKEFLSKKKIMSKVYFDSAHLTDYYKSFGYKEGDLPKTEDVSKRVLSLPIFVDMKKEELNLIISSIKEYFEGMEK